MSEQLVPNIDLSSITSSLKIDEAIQRSRKVMEESKALTYKNSQKKSLIEEKLKSVLSLQTEHSSENLKQFEMPRSYLDIAETPKSNVIAVGKDECQSEVKGLNNKISSLLTQIRLLEMNVSELKQENLLLVEENRQNKMRHKQEIEYLTEMYEEKLKGRHSGNKDLIGMENRLRELEENFTKQVRYNCELEEKINAIGKQTQTIKNDNRILQIEKEYTNNQESISEFQNKLENAKKLLKTTSPKFAETKPKKKRENSKADKEKTKAEKVKPKKKQGKDN